MSIKAIVTDLDGTLLNGEKRLSEKTVRVLQECHKRGILLIPATGRTIEGVPEFVKELPAVRYLIITNGAKIYDLESHEILSEYLLDQHTAARILKYAGSYHILYDVYIRGRGKSEARFLYHLDEYKIEPEIQKLIRRTRDLVPDIIAHVSESQEKIDKINLYFDDPGLRERVREHLSRDGEIAVSSSLYNNLEINHRLADKGLAVKRLAEFLKIGLEEIMVCGDGNNDLPMMLPEVRKIAVSNASEEVKNVADYITLSNEESGVALAIEKFAL